MRIPYTSALFFGTLVIVSACQGGASRMYMDGSDSHATADHVKAR